MKTSGSSNTLVRLIAGATVLGAILAADAALGATTEVCAPPAGTMTPPSTQLGANGALIMSGAGTGGITAPTDLTATAQLYDTSWASPSVAVINLSNEEQTQPQQAVVRLLTATDSTGQAWLYIGGVYSFQGGTTSNDWIVMGFQLGSGANVENWKFVLKRKHVRPGVAFGSGCAIPQQRRVLDRRAEFGARHRQPESARALDVEFRRPRVWATPVADQSLRLGIRWRVIHSIRDRHSNHEYERRGP
jgi:hypothetical protein